MGFSVKFNWVLQINTSGLLDIGKEYNFEKEGNRVFPLDTPIDLINSRREAIAKIKIIHYTNNLDQTTGTYRVIKIYSGQEKEILDNYWMENQ